MNSFIQKQFLPLGLLLAVCVGIFFPAPGIYMAQLPTASVVISIIFFIAGLLLKTDEIWRAVSAWKGIVWGCSSILFVTPLIGVTLAVMLTTDPIFQIGLSLFCCMPTTLSSGVALTGQARGNVALALLLTVLTNIGGIITVPFALVFLVGPLLQFIGPVEISAGNLLLNLCVSILCPLFLGKFCRKFSENWLDKRRPKLSVISNLALISVPWMKFSQSSTRLAEVNMNELIVLIFAGVFIHVFYIIFNAGVVRVLRIDWKEGKAVVLLSSQKTIPVAMTVLAFFPVPEDTKGLIAIPCITFHFGQIIIDALIATRWGNSSTV